MIGSSKSSASGRLAEDQTDLGGRALHSAVGDGFGEGVELVEDSPGDVVIDDG
jgi:hypothetical protein